MQKILFVDGEEIRYEFSRGGVKNINARVRRDGTLYVSAPRLLPFGRVEKFLVANIGKLLPAMHAREKAKAEGERLLREGDRIPLFGEYYTLRLALGERRAVTVEGKEICLTRRAGDGEETCRTALSTYLSNLAKKEISAICRDIYDKFFKFTFPYPILRFRKMVARWGSCHKGKGVITFNTRLVYADRGAIAYVVLHELTHMLHPDHSSRFYAALAARMPDYQRHRATLAKIDLTREKWI